MMYLFSQFWVWLLLAFLFGLVMGWFYYSGSEE